MKIHVMYEKYYSYLFTMVSFRTIYNLTWSRIYLGVKKKLYKVLKEWFCPIRGLHISDVFRLRLIGVLLTFLTIEQFISQE